MNDQKKKINIFQQKQTLSPFVHMSGVFFFYAELSTDVVPLPLNTQFPSTRRKTLSHKKSKYIGVRYIPLTLHRH